MKTSKLFTLTLSDFLKGLVVAVLAAALTILMQSIQTGTFIIDWKAMIFTSIAAAIAYLIKNLGTNSEGKTFKKEPEKD